MPKTAIEIKRVELKSFKVLERMSEETLCFEATVHVNGKKAGVVGNAGHGGPNDWRFEDRELEEALREKVKTMEPHVCTDFGTEMVLDYDMDFYFSMYSELLHETNNNKHTVFKNPKDGEFYMMKTKFTPEVGAELRKKYGEDVEIKNEEMDKFKYLR